MRFIEWETFHVIDLLETFRVTDLLTHNGLNGWSRIIDQSARLGPSETLVACNAGSPLGARPCPE